LSLGRRLREVHLAARHAKRKGTILPLRMVSDDKSHSPADRAADERRRETRVRHCDSQPKLGIRRAPHFYFCCAWPRLHLADGKVSVDETRLHGDAAGGGAVA